ncbi:hypothetical protein AB0H37_02845 [Actinomadura sp. NPDC023710]|uniref:hypothetical protein n=1 Tax=Actinomadura sp. NPDC023710 TaxID=3158219 RepID=UPI003402B915
MLRDELSRRAERDQRVREPAARTGRPTIVQELRDEHEVPHPRALRGAHHVPRDHVIALAAVREVHDAPHSQAAGGQDDWMP